MLSLLLFLCSIGLTILLWIFGFPFFFLFLFIPLIPMFGRDQEILVCPICGWQTNGNERYCPYDGELMELKKKSL